jgi:hypothetical protein
VNRIARAAGVVLLVSTVIVAIPRAASAQTGSSELGPDYVRASAGDLGAGTFQGGGLPARDPSFVPPYTWSRAADSRYCVVFAGAWPPEIATHVTARPYGLVNGNPVPLTGLPGDRLSAWLLDDLTLLPPDARVVGPLVWDLGAPTAPGGDLVILPWCPTPGTAAPWEAPTAAEIWQQTPLPRRAIAASPPGTRGWPGITRLHTFFSSAARPVTTAAVSLRGFDVSVVARPIAYAWSFGDGSTQIAGDPPSAIVPYSRRGDFVVTLYVVWEATAHVVYSPWGISVGDIDLGTVTLPEYLPYHVAEVRAVLRTTPGGR